MDAVQGEIALNANVSAANIRVSVYNANAKHVIRYVQIVQPARATVANSVETAM